MSALRDLARIADHRVPGSAADRFRRRRLQIFESLVASLPPSLRVLDVGGEVRFWEGIDLMPNVREVTLFNLKRQTSAMPHLRPETGDARDLSRFADDEFDVVFSNSMIEHLHNWPDQVRAAREMRRVAPRFFVQTPNRLFPLEPHFLVPGFQFLPVQIRARLLQRFNLGHARRREDPGDALQAVSEIRLLTRREIQELFPGAVLYRERIAGLTKSFVAIGGWDT